MNLLKLGISLLILALFFFDSGMWKELSCLKRRAPLTILSTSFNNNMKSRFCMSLFFFFFFCLYLCTFYMVDIIYCWWLEIFRFAIFEVNDNNIVTPTIVFLVLYRNWEAIAWETTHCRKDLRVKCSDKHHRMSYVWWSCSIPHVTSRGSQASKSSKSIFRLISQICMSQMPNWNQRKWGPRVKDYFVKCSKMN